MSMEVGKVTGLEATTGTELWHPERPAQWSYYLQAQQPYPKVVRFRGAIKTLDELPKASIGDGYFVKAGEILVVRVAGGWHHFDK